MKQKMVLILLVILICVGCIVVRNLNTEAEDTTGEDIEFSRLVEEDNESSRAQIQGDGVYLSEGNSYISKLSSTKIGVGGDTIAATNCEVTVTVIVEKLVDGSWEQVTSWSSTEADSDSVTISKSLTVERGYHYRVKSTHTADSASDTSCTSALRIGN